MIRADQPDGMPALLGVRRAGRIADAALAAVRAAAAPGVRAGELDRLARAVLDKAGARPAMLGYRDDLADGPFPAAVSICINDEISGASDPSRVLSPGDLITADLVCEHLGWHADAARTWVLPGAAPERARLADGSRRVTLAGVRAARHGIAWSTVVGAMASEAARLGVVLLRGFHAHGIGRAMHQPPALALHPSDLADEQQALLAGQILTIEPVVAHAGDDLKKGFVRSGWLDRTPDGSDACFTEATIGVGRLQSAVLAGVLDRDLDMT